MKLNPRKEYEISGQRAYDSFAFDSFAFWTGRAGGIAWCIRFLDNKSALQKQYESCLQEIEEEEKANSQNMVLYYEGRADGVRWCLDNFDNLELPEGPDRKEEK